MAWGATVRAKGNPWLRNETSPPGHWAGAGLEITVLRTKKENGAGQTLMAGWKGSQPMLSCWKGVVSPSSKALPPLLHWPEQLCLSMHWLGSVCWFSCQRRGGGEAIETTIKASLWEGAYCSEEQRGRVSGGENLCQRDCWCSTGA